MKLSEIQKLTSSNGDIMKDYKSYHTKANDKIIHDAKVVSKSTFRGLESQIVLINNKVETNVFFYDKYSSSTILKNAIDENELLNYGDVIYLENGQKWIVVSYETENILYTKWILRLCQIDLKWIDDGGVIHEQPCILDYNTKSNFGEKDDRTMTLPDGRRQLILHKDDNTMKLKRTKRFIIGDEAFEIVDYDYLSDIGLVNLSLKTSQINPVNDNLVLGIADYHNKQNIYSIEIRGAENLSINLNQQLQLDVIAYKNGVQVGVHEINLSSSNPFIGTVDNQGLFTPKGIGVTSITAEYMGQITSVDIRVRDILVNNYSVELVGADSIDSGQKQTYKAVFKNNGAEVDEIAVFSLFSDNGTTTTKNATIKSTTMNTVTLLADMKLLGYVQLHVISENQLISSSKRIRVKSLI